VFGVSLALQTWAYVQRIASDRGQPFTGGAYGGTALCDWIPSIERVLRDNQPAYLVLAFAGNNLTPCTRAAGNRRRFGAGLVALYRRDTQLVIAAARAAGTQVFVVGPPAMRNAVWNDHATGLRAAMHSLAATNTGVVYVDASAVISPVGYRATRPCLSFETAAIGCRGGAIVVRAPDGVHLSAPVGGYSAGAWRFANVLMSGIPNAD
jgi:hypothetical protein